MVVLQSPRVQTFLGRKVIEGLRDKIDADITFKSASIRPFDALVLEEVLVKDPAPEVPGMDTLVYVRNVSARFSIVGLLKGESIFVKRLHVNGGAFNLAITEDPDRPGHTFTNLQRVFRLYSGEEPAEIHWGNLLRARSIEVDDVYFRMENLLGSARYEAKGIVIPEGVIDWNHLRAHLEHFKATGLRMADDLLTCTVQEVRAMELDTRLHIDQFSVRKFRLGKANVHAEDIEGQVDGTTSIDIASLDMDGDIYAYSDIFHAVEMDAVLRDGTCVDMQMISHLAPFLDQMTFRGRVRGRIQGTVSDFTLNDIVVDGVNEALHLRGTGRISGLPSVFDTRLDFQIRDMNFSLEDLDAFIEDWAPEVKLDLEKMAPGERFTVTGNVSGQLEHLRFAGNLDSRIGEARADVTLDNAISKQNPLRIGGHLDTEDLNLGRILGSKDLGRLSLSTRLEAKLPRNGGPEVQVDTLTIGRLEALGYGYSGISAWGHYQATDFDLHLQSRDHNLRMTADAAYHETPTRDGYLDANLKLNYANLEALKLDKRGKSVVPLQALANIQRENGHALGQITTSNTLLENADGHYNIGDIQINIDALDTLHQVALESSLLDASFRGDHSLGQLVQDIKSLVMGTELPALSTERFPAYSGARYQASVNVHRVQDLLAFIAPGVYVESGTQANLDIDEDGFMNAGITSGRLALREQFIKDMKLHLDNNFDALTGEITGSTVALSGLRLNNSRITFYADDNQLGLGYVFDNEAEDGSKAELYALGEVARDHNGLSVTAHALPSNIYYKGDGWGLKSGNISWTKGSLHVERLLANHEDQQLLVDGGLTKGQADTLAITMDQFNLGLVNTIAGDKIPRIDGRATGRALLLSSASPTPGLLAAIVCDSTSIAGRPLGQLALTSNWDEEDQCYRATLRNELDGRNSIGGKASLAPATDDLKVNLHLDRFELGYVHHFLNTIFHDFSGALSGDVQLAGNLKDLQLSSHDLRIEDGQMMLDFTRVPYKINGPVSVDKEGLHFQKVELADGEGGTGSLNGSILFHLNNLDDMRMDAHATVREMRVLALPRGVNSLAYGNAYASGRVDITGPLNKIQLVVNASSAKSGDFHLPLGSSSSSSSRELLSFKQAESDEDADPYELMMANARQTKKQQSDLHFKARIRVTPELRAYIDIGDENSLNAIGSGTLEIDSSTSQGFTLGGDYAIQDGSFHFSVLNLVSRNFTIQDGSTIRFNGDIWDSDLDVKGRYTTKGNLSNLLMSYSESDASSSGRRTVYCGINISGKLRNPEVDFDIEIPDLNPVIQSQVESALNSEDKIQKQFVYLLIAGNFLPTEESGVTTNGSDVLYSNVSSIMSGQLNNIFQKLDIPLDLGLNYQTTQAGKDLFDVAVSTQLFNNRVIVNGTVGNKQLVGGATTNEVAGDLDIEIKLNRSGTLRLSLFSHSADSYTYYLDNSQRNGGGIAYQREFNSFRQFFRELFTGRKRRERMALEAAGRGQRNVVLQVDTTGKTQPVHELR